MLQDGAQTGRSVNQSCNEGLEDFRGGLCKESIIGWEPVSIAHYDIKAWIHFQATMPWKLACGLPET